MAVARATMAVVCGAFAVSAVQCAESAPDNTVGGQAATSGAGTSSGGSSSGGSSSGGSSGFGGTAAFGGNAGTLAVDQVVADIATEQYFIDDPPPQSCDGGAHVVAPGGTPECPNDKNLPGCPCPGVGQTAACWPGKRVHRSHGDCKDGTTTCSSVGENVFTWGPCNGFQGIDPNTFLPYGTTGKAACGCFSAGYWNIANLSPCFSTLNGNVQGAVSTLMPDGRCPAQSDFSFVTGLAPSQPWSTNTVRADCTGYFKLCFTLKAVATKGGTPQPGDCTMKELCTEDYYSAANVTQPFPDLPAWITNSSETACAQAFVDNGGYAEMSVDGTSDECDKIKKVFNTVTYCPLTCADPANQSLPECVNCTNGGGGPF